MQSKSRMRKAILSAAGLIFLDVDDTYYWKFGYLLVDVNPDDEGLEAFTIHYVAGEVEMKNFPLISEEDHPTAWYDSSLKFGIDVKNRIRTAKERLENLRTLKSHIFDNTCLETTVASLRGHSLEDKYVLTDTVKACGITDIILGTFSPVQRRVDDQVALTLSDPNMQKQYAGLSWFIFAEARSDKLSDQLIGKTLAEAWQVIAAFALPVGLERAKEYGKPLKKSKLLS